MLENSESDEQNKDYFCYEFVQAKLMEVILPKEGKITTYVFEVEVENSIFNQFYLKYNLKEKFTNPIFENFSIAQVEATEEKKIYNQDRWDAILHKEFGKSTKKLNLVIENVKIESPVTIIYPLELNWNNLLIKEYEDFKKLIFIPKGTNTLHFGSFKEKFRYRFVFHIDKPVDNLELLIRTVTKTEEKIDK